MPFCRILTFAGDKPQWGMVKPGFHGDHNLTDEQGAAAEFMNFDPAKQVYDLRLNSARRRFKGDDLVAVEWHNPKLHTHFRLSQSPRPSRGPSRTCSPSCGSPATIGRRRPSGSP